MGATHAGTNMGYYAGAPTVMKTVSEFGNKKRKSKFVTGSKNSEGPYGQRDGRYGAQPPRLKKKIRPFSAPRH